MSKDNDAPDPIRARWFGAPWNAPICSESPALAPPTHRACAYCGRTIGPADRGIILPWAKPGRTVASDEPVHLACVYRLTDIMPADEIERFLPADE